MSRTAVDPSDTLAARCRAPFLAGALVEWREVNAEPPADVVVRILARYPGDPIVARHLGTPRDLGPVDTRRFHRR